MDERKWNYLVLETDKALSKIDDLGDSELRLGKNLIRLAVNKLVYSELDINDYIRDLMLFDDYKRPAVKPDFYSLTDSTTAPVQAEEDPVKKR